ncbi:hypothetical protein BJ165DRAFT_1614983 [Panaeolus papilionaceus]|nr:hypothetical protein BJ165DRAFT_1614983 [Panaeolus papilionaceus]
MSAVYSIEYQGITVSAANSKGRLYPILRQNISSSHSEQSMTVHFAVPNMAIAQPRRVVRILWSRSEQVQGIHYCTLKAICNTTNLKQSDFPLEVHHWMGALARNTNYSSERGYRRNQGWPMVTPKPMGSELAKVDFEIRKVRNPEVISAKMPMWTSSSHGPPPSMEQLKKSGVEVHLETSSIVFHFIFEAVAFGPASHLLSRGSKRKREEDTVAKRWTIELSDDSDDDDSLNVPRESGTSQKRQKQPPRGSNSTRAPPVIVDLTVDDPPQLTDPKLSIVGAWRRLNALTVEKGELVDRIQKMIKEDEARVQEMKVFMSKYEK